MRPDGSSPLSRRERWGATGVAIIIAVIITAIFKSPLWGLLALILATLVTNGVMLEIRQRRDRR
ncbi:hypothetical protein M1O29_01780 [Dehalococcoidia bacterium]|nr:hypothetical protein [Dehalococcoidia bacterium]